MDISLFIGLKCYLSGICSGNDSMPFGLYYPIIGLNEFITFFLGCMVCNTSELDLLT